MISMVAAPIALADDTYPSNCVEELPLNDTIVSWQDEGMVIMEDGKGFATMYNNKNGILLQVLIKDRQLQQQLLSRGMVVYVDPNGKKKKKYAVLFPTLPIPKPGEHTKGFPPERPYVNQQDTAGLFGDIQPHGSHHRQDKLSKEKRERMLRFLVSQLASATATFINDDEESILSQDSAKVFTSGNNLVFTAYIGYNQLGKTGKKGDISLGITIKKRESSEDMPPFGMFGPLREECHQEE